MRWFYRQDTEHDCRTELFALYSSELSCTHTHTHTHVTQTHPHTHTRTYSLLRPLAFLDPLCTYLAHALESWTHYLHSQTTLGRWPLTSLVYDVSDMDRSELSQSRVHLGPAQRQCGHVPTTAKRSVVLNIRISEYTDYHVKIRSFSNLVQVERLKIWPSTYVYENDRTSGAKPGNLTSVSFEHKPHRSVEVLLGILFGVQLTYTMMPLFLWHVYIPYITLSLFFMHFSFAFLYSLHPYCLRLCNVYTNMGKFYTRVRAFEKTCLVVSKDLNQ